MAKYTANLVPHIFEVSSDTVTSGDYDFDVGKLHDPLPFFLDGFYFVDGSGDPVGASAGTVTVQVSSDGVLWRDVVDGEFPATTLPSEITPPSGVAPVVKLRITLASVTGASGFKANFVKGE
jgi:hypothetical protein